MFHHWISLRKVASRILKNIDVDVAMTKNTTITTGKTGFVGNRPHQKDWTLQADNPQILAQRRIFSIFRIQVWSIVLKIFRSGLKALHAEKTYPRSWRHHPWLKRTWKRTRNRVKSHRSLIWNLIAKIYFRVKKRKFINIESKSYLTGKCILLSLIQAKRWN